MTPVQIDIQDARHIIQQEADALNNMALCQDDNFIRACQAIHQCTGSVVLSGIGKAGIIAQKISATLASTGTPSHFLHAAEAIHGDLGRLRSDDLVIVLSHSGSSEEIVRLIALIKQQGLPMIAITGDRQSPLAQYSNLTLWLGNIEEVCPLGVAPSTSTTCMLALGDALALTVMKARNFNAEDYARYHPGGALGRKLVTVEQASLYSHQERLPVASDRCTVQEAIVQSETNATMRHGCIMLVDDKGRLSGLITDGDLRRRIKNQFDQLHSLPVAEIMTRQPKVVKPKTLASEAMAIIHKHRIDELPVVDDNNIPVGLIDVQDLIALKVIQ